jgi:hypothetical protein
MTREDLKPGMVILFEYQLMNYPDCWMRHCGIVIQAKDRLCVYCLRNGHNTVFSKCAGIRGIQQLPWSLQYE